MCSFDRVPPPLSTYVDTDIIQVIKWPRLLPPTLFLHTHNLNSWKAWQRGYIEHLSEACTFLFQVIFESLSCTDELVACARLCTFHCNVWT